MMENYYYWNMWQQLYAFKLKSWWVIICRRQQDWWELLVVGRHGNDDNNDGNWWCVIIIIRLNCVWRFGFVQAVDAMFVDAKNSAAKFPNIIILYYGCACDVFRMRCVCVWRRNEWMNGVCKKWRCNWWDVVFPSFCDITRER